MKASLLFATVAAIFSLVSATTQAASPQSPAQEPSLISAFAGPHNGTLLLSAGTESLGGTTAGGFKTSKKKEVGTLTLSTLIPQNGSSFTLIEQYRFDKKKITYTITEVFSNGTSASGTGIGTAKIRKNAIVYSVLLNIEGNSLFVQGTAKLAKNNRLNVTESLSGSTGSLLASYRLDGKKKKK